MKAIAYVDGFNLYYRAVKGTPYKWLNLRKVFELLVPEYDVGTIKYFTAHVSGKPDPTKPQRQNIFLDALRSVGCEIIVGKFNVHPTLMPLESNPSQLVSVIKTEEKGSDVNIASHLLINAITRQCEAAIVLTNDSDLVTPIHYTHNVLGTPVVIVNPSQTNTSKELAKIGANIRILRSGVLAASQFPTQIHYKKRVLTKPSVWT